MILSVIIVPVGRRMRITGKVKRGCFGMAEEEAKVAMAMLRREGKLGIPEKS